MIVNSARFIISNTDVRKCPEEIKHEFAFIGRSNVGKSSLINMLTGHKALAQTSSTPGKTLLINHFLINHEYILNRAQMTCLFLLVDGRHKPQKIDMEFMQWLGENEVPFAIVFTKLDKLSSNAAKHATAAYCEELLEQWEELPPIFRTSAVDKRGRTGLLEYIDQLCRLPLETEE